MVSVKTGSEFELQSGIGQTLWPDEWHIAGSGPGFVDLAIPGPPRPASAIYMIKFRTKIFMNSTTFSVSVSNSKRPGTIQVASDGDATSFLTSQSLVVVGDLDDTSILSNVQLSPRIITPNEDGINDLANLRFSIFRLNGSVNFSVATYDLSGRIIRDLSFERSSASGDHVVVWDGLDSQGQLVAPGTYILRLEFSVDVGQESVSLPVSVIY